jgi:hypothetical protein
MRPARHRKIDESVFPRRRGKSKLFKRKLSNFCPWKACHISTSAVLILINPREDFECAPPATGKETSPFSPAARSKSKLFKRKLSNFRQRNACPISASAVLVLINPREDFQCAPPATGKETSPFSPAAGGASKLFKRKLSNFCHCKACPISTSAVLILINPREDFQSARSVSKLFKRKLRIFRQRNACPISTSAVLILINPREDFQCAPPATGKETVREEDTKRLQI